MKLLPSLKSYVVLAGYDCDLYNDTLSGWRRVEKKERNMLNDERIEVMWISPKTAEALDRERAEKRAVIDRIKALAKKS